MSQVSRQTVRMLILDHKLRSQQRNLRPVSSELRVITRDACDIIHKALPRGQIRLENDLVDTKQEKTE